MPTITDTYTITIQITPHGIADVIQPVTAPATVDPNTAFDLAYTVKNMGTVTDLIYGRLTIGGVEVTGSYWSQNLAPNTTVTKTFTFQAGITAQTTIVIEVGHI